MCFKFLPLSTSYSHVYTCWTSIWLYHNTNIVIVIVYVSSLTNLGAKQLLKILITNSFFHEDFFLNFLNFHYFLCLEYRSLWYLSCFWCWRWSIETLIIELHSIRSWMETRLFILIHSFCWVYIDQLIDDSLIKQ